tara:strand:- start:5514 stop:5702 length:189 start_codon:yes stop_codon:yes gene_type:complete
MPYYIKRPAAITPGDVYWTGGSSWSEDFSKKKTYVNKSTADAKLVNTDGRNGGFKNATVVGI